MEKGLLEKTGKPLAAWIAIVKQQSFEKHGEIVNFLKTEHGMTHGFANFVSLKARAADAGSQVGGELIKNQYKGKEALKPIYDFIIAEVQEFGTDVEIAPKKAAVSLRTSKQFALIQPSTKTRVDLGLKLKGFEPEGKLETSGPFGAMCSHRIKLMDVADVDKEVLDYLKMAYDASK